MAWRYSDNDLSRYLKPTLTVSIALHLVLLLNISISLPNSEPVVFDVQLITEPPRIRPPQRQIVTPPKEQIPSMKVPDQADFLSDSNYAAEKQQVRRGTLEAGRVIAPPKQEQTETEGATNNRPASGKESDNKGRPSAKAPATNTSSTHTQRGTAPILKLDQNTLLEKFSVEKDEKRNDSGRDAEARLMPQAFSRPQGSGAQFLGAQGTIDHLPNLPDGDITLLNAKASRFAVFVRRVALRVFSELRQVGWEELSMAEVRSIKSETRIEAVLSLKGKLLSVKVLNGSGSILFDRVVQSAVNSGASDPNPPAEAVADDGNIHFIFLSRSWSRPAVSPRTGAPTERRWLLLSTGLL